jgi:glyoxylase-like metal-dependent hydrolase (beta-lactamase superfamily II)
MTANKNPEAQSSSENCLEIADGIYHLKLPLGSTGMTNLNKINIYLVKGTDGWIMIDTGWYSKLAQETLEDAFEKIKITYADIKTIVITHSHPDHFGMAGRIKHISPGTQMIMHRWEADLIESRYIKFTEPQRQMLELLSRYGTPENELMDLSLSSMPSLEFVAVTLPDHVLYGGEIIQTGIYTLEVIWTPGHSPGHICLYEPENKILFSGDHIFQNITPNIGYHVLSGDDPLGDYLHALSKLKYLSINKIYPGHYEPFSNAVERINAAYEHHQKREEEILKIIGESSCDAYYVASRLVWGNRNQKWNKFPPLQKRFALTETIAHIERMRWEGKVRKTFKENRFLFSQISGMN